MTVQKTISTAFHRLEFSHRIAIAVFLILLILRLAIINTPSPTTSVDNCIEPSSGGFPIECGFVFDEAHYVPAVRKLLRGVSTNHEHPPLSKLLIAASMIAFGDNPVGWRLAPAILSSAAASFTTLIAWHLTRRRDLTLLATIFIATDVMLFNIGSIAMLDGPAMFFLVAGTWLFLKSRYSAAAALLALAFLCKTAVLFNIVALVAYLLLVAYSKRGKLMDAVAEWSPAFEKTVIIMLAVSIAGIAAYDYGFRAFNNPFAHLDYMISYHSQLRYDCKEFQLPLRCTVIDSDGKRTVIDLPLSWISPISPFSPAPYHLVTVSSGDRSWHPVAYWGIYSPAWWTTGLVLAITAYNTVRTRGKDSQQAFIFSWMLFGYGPYFLLAHLLNRYVYTFYFLPTLPALAVGLPLVLSDDKFSKVVVWGVAVIQIVWFFIYFPVKSDTYIQILELLNLPR
ncbi:MAG: phospholipid carrier-dependent glycosyltransferase [Candidatus Caldarchaeum sp.]|nr:phospholipid carrier-dependent glycosyltransferase [Candidatus Caldarchaeum sp.]